MGGTAAATHARHRISFGDDHVLGDLRERFDAVLEHPEQADGWLTARVKRPVLVLGSLDGIETGIRQLVRRRPLEVEQVELAAGGRVTVPTLAEMLRVKAWLILRRRPTTCPPSTCAATAGWSPAGRRGPPSPTSAAPRQRGC